MATGVTIDFTANLARFTSSIDKATNDLNKFQRNTTRISKRVSRTFTNLGRTFGAAFAGLSLGNIAAGIVDTSRKFEILKTSLIAVTGSADAAARAFSEIEQFTRNTPFQVEETVTAFRKLSALGLRATTEDLLSFGNTAVAMGKSLDQFIEAVADASVGEFERLKEFGIKARKDGEQIRFTFQGIETVIRNSSEEITKYLTDIGNVEFAGAAVRQVNTLQGAFSNFSDAIDGLAVAIGESGLNKAIADLTNQFTGFVRSATSFIKSFQEVDRGLNITQIQNRIEELRQSIRDSRAEFESFSIDSLNPFSKGKNLADIALASREIERLKERLAELKAENDDFDLNKTETAVNSLSGACKDCAIEKLSNTVDKTGKAADRAAERLIEFASRLTNEFNPAQAVQEELQEIEKAFNEGLISPEVYFDAVFDQMEKMNELSESVDFDPALEELTRFAESVTEQFNPADAVARELVRLEEAFDQGLISPEVYFEALVFQMDRLEEKTEETGSKITDFAKQAAKNLQDAFADFLFDPFDDGLKGMIDSFSDSLRRMAAELASQQLLTQFFGFLGDSNLGLGSFADDFISSLAGRAEGGPVTAGTPYIVGEKGPELFVPKSSGAIVPNGSIAGRLTQNINISLSGNVDPRSIQQIRTEVGRATSRALARNT